MENLISEIVTGNIPPIIVQFQNGQIRGGQEEKMLNSVYKNKKNQTIAAVATNDILYKGVVSAEDDLYKNFLLARNRKTGKVRLIQVDKAILSPQVKKKPVPEKILDKSLSNGTDANSSLRELNKQFGSKKIKRMTEQKERLQMDISNVKEHLEQTVAAIEVDEADMLSSKVDENDNLYRPPINRDASTREQVYSLEKMLPKKVFNELDEEATTVLNSDLDEYELSPYVKQQIQLLQETGGASQHEKCKILLYINYLIQYVLKPARLVNNRLVICQASKQVNSYILENFSLPSTTGRTRPFSMKDKVICYILAMGMLALDFQIDIEAIGKDIKVGVKKLQEMGRVLGFSLSGKDKLSMVLKLPLPAPVSISPKKRKR